MPYRLTVQDIAYSERASHFARPFRFGAVVVKRRKCSFTSKSRSKERAEPGASAELMVPKWFDKRPALSADETVKSCAGRCGSRASLSGASGFETAFGLHAANIGPQVAACAREDIPPLAAGFGPAQIDKAILDALLRAERPNFFTAWRQYPRSRRAADARPR